MIEILQTFILTNSIIKERCNRILWPPLKILAPALIYSAKQTRGPERWLRRIGYRRSYGDPCGGDALPDGDSNTQYTLYCGNQCPARLLITVLPSFLWVQHHEYAVVVMVLSWKYSSTYGLTLMRLSYVANLSGATIRHAPMHMVLKMHIIEISELKLWSKELSGGGNAYGVAWGKSQLGTLQCGRLGSQRLTAWLGQNDLF